MKVRPTPLSQLALVSGALLAAVDDLAAEFSQLPLSLIYEKAGEARATAAIQLPDEVAYREAIAREARIHLQREVAARVTS